MVYFDQRGSGRSDRPQNGDYAIPTLVADIQALRQVLGVPRIALIAHSFGVLLALEYAAEHPANVTRVVLSGGVSDLPAAIRAQCERLAEVNPEAYTRAKEAAAGGEMACDIFRALPGRQAETFFESNMFPDRRTLARIDSVDAANGYRNTGEMGRALFAGGLLQYRFARHEHLTMPVLVIAGLQDHQGGREPHRELVRRLPNARLLEYERSGHFMYVDEPERFTRDVTAFLSAPSDQQLEG
jgi:proline iminopeptidase